MYSLIEYSDIYLEAFGSLWQYYRDEPALDKNDNIIDSPANHSISFKLKTKTKKQPNRQRWHKRC